MSSASDCNDFDENSEKTEKTFYAVGYGLLNHTV